MSFVPKGWSVKTFGEILSLITNGMNGKQNKEGNGIPVSRIETIADQRVDLSRVGFLAEYDKGKIDKYRLEEGDILFSHINSPIHLGKTALVPADVVLYHGVNLLRLKCEKSVDPRFFNYYCKYLRALGEFSKNAQHAVNQSSINQKKLKAFELVAPSLEEQKRIADKLDSVLAKVEAAQARLDKIPAILKRFRQSVLAAATSGELTKEWREENLVVEPASELKARWLAQRKLSFETNQSKLVGEGRIKRAKKFKQPVQADTQTVKLKEDQKLPVTWEVVSVSEFADCLDNQRIPVKKENRLAAKGLYPYFGANGEVDKVDDFIFDDDLVMVTEDETFYGREKPIAFRYSGKCWVNNHAHVLRAPNEVGNKFLCYSLMYYHVIPWLTGTTGRAKLTQAALNSLPVNMPPELEQAEIVRRVEDLLCKADVLERQFWVAHAKVAKLTQALLTKAFKGELLPSSVDSHIEAIESSIEALNA